MAKIVSEKRTVGPLHPGDKHVGLCIGEASQVKKNLMNLPMRSARYSSSGLVSPQNSLDMAPGIRQVGVTTPAHPWCGFGLRSATCASTRTGIKFPTALPNMAAG
jgi:hypothetical protein